MSHSYESIEPGARASAARIGASAAQLMVEHQDWSVDECLRMALMLEWFLYGNLYAATSDEPPIGLLGHSPFNSPRLRGES